MDITIAIDAMGGDYAPAHPVAGAVLAAREYGARLVLVRPDQYVAWAGDITPPDAADVIRQVAGLD